MPEPTPEAIYPARTPVRVLVVDDQPLERTGIALILDSDDHISVVGEAGNGLEALAAVSAQHPDVVLMDMRMPIMDGIEATRIIAERYPDTRVIALTTFDLDEYAFGSLQAGASAFLLKSTKPAALVDAVQTVASGSAVAAPRLTARLIEHYLAPTRAPATASTDPSLLELLSPRERDVFIGIVRGLSNAELSAELVLAQSTIKSHVNAIFTKLGVRDRVHAVILGYELGLVPGR
ncbi:response regulator [Leucobacter sp. NPDC058333]|uniref:response regulator transcription factor n=1 Tax=Leucobacter sp. NPDC058333 TaxID=3346450 RepID=UPI00365F8AD5